MGNFKKHVTSMSCTLETTTQSCDNGQWIPFYGQLSINHNIDAHYQVKDSLYMPWTPRA